MFETLFRVNRKMRLIVWITILTVKFSNAERAGITNCTTETYGSTFPFGTPSNTASGYYMMQDPDYQFKCCGVVNTIQYTGVDGSLDFYVWRQDGDTNFKLISKQTYTVTSSSSGFQVPENKRASFREGDLFGWYIPPTSAGVIRAVTNNDIHLNWYTSSISATTVGASEGWYNKDVIANTEVLIKITSTESTPPFFRNLPIIKVFNVEDLKYGGVTLMTLSYDDIDPDDTGGLSVSLSPEWDDLFELVDPAPGTNAVYVKTKETFTAGTYLPVFRVEEDHCGRTATATLTLSVINETPSITNLPAFASIHEDTVDETSLYTVTMSDPADQKMWCKGDWDIGTAADGKTPFIVKMKSTEAGNSEAEIYLIEYPKLDYDINSTYSLTIKCTDTGGITVSGIFKVNIIENQMPIFSNLGNVVEIDASSVYTGYTVFTVSTTDVELDQVRFTCTNCGGSSVPFAIYDSGEVQVMDLLLFNLDTLYNLTITATDVRATTAPNYLLVYVNSTNAAPVFAGQSINVWENADLGKSLYQMSATDNDTSDSLTYFMTVDPDEGYDLFELSSTGELTTHSKYTIDYELLSGTRTYTLTAYVNDGKSSATATFSVTVNNENEAPYFLASEYIINQFEIDPPGGLFTDNPKLVTAEDPDMGDSLNFSMDCGDYNRYIAIDHTTANLSFPIGYDLDNTTLNLPTYFQCIVFVTDTNLNDSCTLHVNIEYDNEHTPTMTLASLIKIPYDTPMGYVITQVEASDNDVGPNATLTYEIEPADNAYFVIDEDGTIRASRNVTPLENSYVELTVFVTDQGLKSATGTVTISVLESDAVVTNTTDRSWEFVEDPRNTTWVTMSVITMATCLLLVLFIIIRCCVQRTTPLINFNLRSLLPKKEPKRRLDKKGRAMPLFGKQAQPQYRHVHAREVLRQSPEPAPTPVEINSLRPGSATSGRVTVTDVRVKDKEPSWMDGTSSPISAAAPMKSVAHARTDDWEYLNPNRRADTISSENMYGENKISPTPSTALSKQRRTSSQRMTQAVHIPVSPSPVMFDNVGDDDDFKSERLSVASPSSQLGEEEPNY